MAVCLSGQHVLKWCCAVEGPLAFAVAAVLQPVLFLGHLGPVADQETGGAGEFIGLLGYNDDGQFFAG